MSSCEALKGTQLPPPPFHLEDFSPGQADLPLWLQSCHLFKHTCGAATTPFPASLLRHVLSLLSASSWGGIVHTVLYFSLQSDEVIIINPFTDEKPEAETGKVPQTMKHFEIVEPRFGPQTQAHSRKISGLYATPLLGL